MKKLTDTYLHKAYCCGGNCCILQNHCHIHQIVSMICTIVCLHGSICICVCVGGGGVGWSGVVWCGVWCVGVVWCGVVWVWCGCVYICLCMQNWSTCRQIILLVSDGMVVLHRIANNKNNQIKTCIQFSDKFITSLKGLVNG